MPSNVVTLTFNLGNEHPTTEYVEWLARELAERLDDDSDHIAITVQEQPRDYDLAAALQQYLQQIRNCQLHLADASYDTRTKPLEPGEVRTSVLSRITPIDIITDTYQDPLNTNKGAATVTAGSLKVHGLHLSSDRDDQRAAEFTRISRVHSGEPMTYEDMEQEAATYFTTIFSGDFNYRDVYRPDETDDGQHPLYDELPQTRLLRVTGGLSLAAKNQDQPYTFEGTTDELSQQRGNKGETQGGFLDTIGTRAGSRITMGDAAVLAPNNTTITNNSDHKPVLAIATIGDQTPSLFEQVRDMVYHELEGFADQDLLGQVALMEEGQVEDQVDSKETLELIFNYFMVIKQMWVDAELMRLAGDTPSFTAIAGTFDATQPDTLYSPNSAIGRLVDLGNLEIRGIINQGNIQPQNINSMEKQSQSIITKITLPRNNNSLGQKIKELWNKMWASLHHFFGAKADSTTQQKRSGHRTSLSQPFCMFNNHNTPGIDPQLQEISHREQATNR